MLVQIPKVLSVEQVSFVREKLDAAGEAWIDGRVTAGHQGARVKRNLQIAENTPIAYELGDLILAELERNRCVFRDLQITLDRRALMACRRTTIDPCLPRSIKLFSHQTYLFDAQYLGDLY